MNDRTDDTELLALIRQATNEVAPDLKPPLARFVLVIRPDHELTAVRAEVEAALQPLGAVVTRLSDSDNRALVVTLPERMFNGDDKLAFEAAYAFVRRFSLEAAEPELLTEFFPEEDARGDGPRIRSFTAGCWAPEDDDLNDNTRWAIEKLKIPAAWAYSESKGRPSRGKDIIIAQPDTGLAPHAELAGVVKVPGYDFIGGDSDPADPLDYSGNPGHGTATASVVVSKEAGQISGSAPAAKHMPLRAIESVIRISQVSVAQAIDFATENGAHVITMSLGGLPSFSLYRALNRAVSADVIVLAAAGNCVGVVVWPAAYDSCIAVAGTNSKDERWRGSSGGGGVDISAPAENVFRAFVANGQPPRVGQGQGTSFAVALSAGVAACWLAHHGRANLIRAARQRGETLQAMFLRLVRATARKPQGWDSAELGAGIVDAEALLRANFDLARGQAPQPEADPYAAHGYSVRRLAARTIGTEASEVDLDWNLYGPEIAHNLLSKRLPRRPGSARVRTQGAARSDADLSPTLRRLASANPKLKSALEAPANPVPRGDE